jgi:catechol 2,3-dioxygenase-like lactoylglutathione lyase family enzyme
LKERTMIDHIILTVSDVKRSLTFYEAALKPLNIKFFMPYKGEDGHPDLWGFGDGQRAFFWIKQGKPDPATIHWGFVAEIRIRSMNSTRPQCPLVPGTTFRPAHDWNTIRDTTPPMYSTPTGIHSKSSIKASDGTAHNQGSGGDKRSCDRHDHHGSRQFGIAGSSGRADSAAVTPKQKLAVAA